MSRKPLLDPNRAYTFSNYFALNADPFDLVAEFGSEDIETVMRILLAALIPRVS